MPELVEDGAADGADEVDDGVGDNVRRLGELVARGLQGEMLKLARSGSVPVVLVTSAIAIRMAW